MATTLPPRIVWCVTNGGRYHRQVVAAWLYPSRNGSRRQYAVCVRVYNEADDEQKGFKAAIPITRVFANEQEAWDWIRFCRAYGSGVLDDAGERSIEKAWVDYHKNAGGGKNVPLGKVSADEVDKNIRADTGTSR